MRVDVMEKNEGNKLIAEFMGLEKHPMENWWMVPPKYSTGLTHNWSDLKFEISWDWLMPVVEKIEWMGYNSVIELLPTKTEHRAFFYDGNGFEIGRRDENKLICVWLACIEFIKWYHSNPNRTGQKLKDDE